VRDRGREAVVRGLASVALATAEGGGTEDAARLQLIQVLRAHGTADPALAAEAAVAVADEVRAAAGHGADAAAVEEEPAIDEAEAQRVREALGVPSPSEQLVAALVAREWLERFAADLAR